MNSILKKQGLTVEQLSMIESEVTRNAKNPTLAYVLWFFTGGLGGHRYYLGNIGIAIAMTLTLGGLGIWALIDVFFIGGAIKNHNDQIENEAIEKVKLYRDAA
jgi:TM2 domain-containing membrane protein YozV